MAANAEHDPANPTTVERKSARELVITRRFKAPAHLVYAAWTTPELLMRWWAPKSFGVTFVSCEADVRSGGRYRFVFRLESSGQTMAFFGRYTEVIPNARLVWTNDETDEPGAVTTVTFAEKDDETVVVMHDLYPTERALEEAIAGSATGFNETFGQLDALLEATGRCDDGDDP